MKAKNNKKSSHHLRHSPLGQDIERPNGKLRAPRQDNRDDIEDDQADADFFPDEIRSKIAKQARDQRYEFSGPPYMKSNPTVFDKRIVKGESYDSDAEDDDSMGENDVDDYEEEGIEDGDNLVDIEQGYVIGSAGLSEAEEALVDKFLHADKLESRTLADIIMDKLQEKKDSQGQQGFENMSQQGQEIPAKVVEVYSAVGRLLQHYRSGKLPKALKMLPHLKNWEQVLWLTRPDEWSPAATYACTRIFASNLNEKMAQRFLNFVLLEKCRDDIRTHRKLNYYFYMAIRKAMYKPSAFYKGFLLPLAQSGNCTLREAAIIGSALSKLSIPGIHSAAVLLRLAELPYSGSTSLFIKILLNKKYALPRRVVDALVNHFLTFEKESRLLPVIWHQSLLVFVQRYKFEFISEQKEKLKQLVKIQIHHQISAEVLRELMADRKLK